MSLIVIRVGQPHLVTGPSARSANIPEEYEIETTPLAPGARSANWRGYFNAQLKGPLVAFHNGEKITVYCDPGTEPDWLERVDAAIAKASEQENSASDESDR